MIGTKVIRLWDNNEMYELVLDRTYTHIVGESGSGKTLLVMHLLNYFNKNRSDLFLESDARVRVIRTAGDILAFCDVTKECIYILDEDVCDSLINRVDEDYVNAYSYLNSKLKDDKKGGYPNSYFVFMSREPVFNVNIDIMSIYELVSSHEKGRLVKRLGYCVNWETKNCIDVQLALVEGSGSDYLFFKNTLINCDVIPCGGKNNIAPYLSCALENDYKNIFVFADGASYGYNLLLHKELFFNSEGDIDIRLYFPNSFEWMILASGLFKVDEDMLNNPQDYFDSKDFDGIEQFFTNLLMVIVKNPSNRNYKFSALSPKGYKYYPERLVYTKKGSKSGYNHFVDVVLLSEIGVQKMYNLIGEISNYVEDVEIVNYRRCKNLPIISEKGRNLLFKLSRVIKLKNKRRSDLTKC